MNILKIATSALTTVVLGLCVSGYEVPAHGEKRSEGRTLRSLDEYLETARKVHPSLALVDDKTSAQREKEAVAGRWKSPALQFSFAPRPIETRLGSQHFSLGVEQVIPWPQRLKGEKRMQRWRTQAMVDTGRELRIRVESRIAQLYWQLCLIDEEERLYKEHEELLQGVLATVRARVETGSANYSDLGQMQLSLGRLQDHSEMHRLRREELEAELRFGLSNGETGWSFECSQPASEKKLTTSRLSILEKIGTHPLSKRLEKLRKATEQQASVKALSNLPVLRVGAKWMAVADNSSAPDSGRDAIQLNAMVSVPVWEWINGSEEKSYVKQALAIESERKETLLSIRRGIDLALAGLSEARRKAKLVEGQLLPQAEANYLAILGEYQVNSQNLTAVIAAQEAIVQLKIERAQALSSQNIAWSKLEYWAGEKMSSGGGKNYE